MKKIIFLFLFLPSILLAQKTKTEYHHLKLKSSEGKVDEKNHRTGEWKFWDHHGNLVAIRHYKNDMLDGTSINEKYDWEPTEPQLTLLQTNKSLYEKAIKRQKESKVDTIIEKIEYKENKLHGIKYVYDANGNQVSETTYFENEKNGVAKNYDYKTGILSTIEYYSFNYLDSLLGFDDNGNLVKRMARLNLNPKTYKRTILYERGMMVQKEELWYEVGETIATICNYENNIEVDCYTTIVRDDGQKSVPIEPETYKNQIPVLEKGEVFQQQQDVIHEFPDQEAKFPGGPEAMLKYIKEKYQLPQGVTLPDRNKIYLSIVVEKDGSLTDIKVLRGIGEEFDKEAIRLIKAMPKWEPAEISGKLVRSRMTIPVIIELK